MTLPHRWEIVQRHRPRAAHVVAVIDHGPQPVVLDTHEIEPAKRRQAGRQGAHARTVLHDVGRHALDQDTAQIVEATAQPRSRGRPSGSFDLGDTGQRGPGPLVVQVAREEKMGLDAGRQGLQEIRLTDAPAAQVSVRRFGRDPEGPHHRLRGLSPRASSSSTTRCSPAMNALGAWSRRTRSNAPRS